MSKELGVAKKTVKQIQIVKLLNGKFVKKKKRSKVVWVRKEGRKGEVEMAAGRRSSAARLPS